MKALQRFSAPDLGEVDVGQEFECPVDRGKAFETYGLAAKMDAAPKNKMADAPKNKGKRNAG